MINWGGCTWAVPSDSNKWRAAETTVYSSKKSHILIARRNSNCVCCMIPEKNSRNMPKRLTARRLTASMQQQQKLHKTVQKYPTRPWRQCKDFYVGPIRWSMVRSEVGMEGRSIFTSVGRSPTQHESKFTIWTAVMKAYGQNWNITKYGRWPTSVEQKLLGKLP